MDVLLLCAVSVSNVEHMAQDLTLGATSEGVAVFVHGHCRRPVRVNAVAASLLLPYETARRRTNDLVRLGLIERRAGEGVVVPSSVVARPNMEAGLEAFATLKEGFLARLAKIGVTRRDGVAMEPEGAHQRGPARRGYQGCSS